MSSQDRFDELVTKVPNAKARALFKELGQKQLSSWNNHSFDIMEIFADAPFSGVTHNRYVWTMFQGTPLAWLFYVDDPSFTSELKDDLDKLTDDYKVVVGLIRSL